MTFWTVLHKNNAATVLVALARHFISLVQNFLVFKWNWPVLPRLMLGWGDTDGASEV